jgi:Kyakuja-Dileera-Zisupton transposase
MYVLEDEPPLHYSMLACMDGNNSLKHIIRKSQENNNDKHLNLSIYDTDYYMTCAEVNHFKDEIRGRSGTTNNGSEVMLL